MKEFKPLVSIVIPVYNGELFIREAINSCLKQTYPNIEIVVVNDGSKDKTEEIIQKEYQNKVRYYKKSNGGVASALNLAIRKAKGQYISWLSHDDIYLPNKINYQIELLKVLPEDVRSSSIIYTNYSVIDKHGGVISESSNIQRFSLNKLEDPYFPLLHGLVHGCTLLIPSKCFGGQNIFKEELRYTQDYDLWYELFPKFNLRFLETVTVLSRSHEGQGTKNVTPRAEEEYDELWLKMLKGISSEQMKFMEGNELNFFNRMLEITYDAKYMGVVEYIEAKIVELRSRRINKLKSKLFSILKLPLLLDPRYRQIQKLELENKYLRIKIDYLLKRVSEIQSLIGDTTKSQNEKLSDIRSIINSNGIRK